MKGIGVRQPKKFSCEWSFAYHLKKFSPVESFSVCGMMYDFIMMILYNLFELIILIIRHINIATCIMPIILWTKQKQLTQLEKCVDYRKQGIGLLRTYCQERT